MIINPRANTQAPSTWCGPPCSQQHLRAWGSKAPRWLRALRVCCCCLDHRALHLLSLGAETWSWFSTLRAAGPCPGAKPRHPGLLWPRQDRGLHKPTNLQTLAASASRGLRKVRACRNFKAVPWISGATLKEHLVVGLYRPGSSLSQTPKGPSLLNSNVESESVT